MTLWINRPLMTAASLLCAIASVNASHIFNDQQNDLYNGRHSSKMAVKNFKRNKNFHSSQANMAHNNVSYTSSNQQNGDQNNGHHPSNTTVNHGKRKKNFHNNTLHMSDNQPNDFYNAHQTSNTVFLENGINALDFSESAALWKNLVQSNINTFDPNVKERWPELVLEASKAQFEHAKRLGSPHQMIAIYDAFNILHCPLILTGINPDAYFNGLNLPDPWTPHLAEMYGTLRAYVSDEEDMPSHEKSWHNFLSNPKGILGHSARVTFTFQNWTLMESLTLSHAYMLGRSANTIKNPNNAQLLRVQRDKLIQEAQTSRNKRKYEMQ